MRTILLVIALLILIALALVWTGVINLNRNSNGSVSIETRDVEVWLGFELHGAAARLSAPLHWAIFALGAWGFWRARPWIVPCAAGYCFYVALSHLIWSEASPHGHGWRMGLVQAAALSVPGFLLLRARRGLRGSA